MNTERDKGSQDYSRIRGAFLTEAMGECWHEVFKHDGENGTSTKYAWCPKCEKRILTTDYYPPHAIAVQDTNFSTWEGFGTLWEWAQKQEWWNRFCWQDTYRYSSFSHSSNILINPDRFADAVYKFLKERGGK